MNPIASMHIFPGTLWGIICGMQFFGCFHWERWNWGQESCKEEKSVPKTEWTQNYMVDSKYTHFPWRSATRPCCSSSHCPWASNFVLPSGAYWWLSPCLSLSLSIALLLSVYDSPLLFGALALWTWSEHLRHFIPRFYVKDRKIGLHVRCRAATCNWWSIWSSRRLANEAMQRKTTTVFFVGFVIVSHWILHVCYQQILKPKEKAIVYDHV